MSQGTQADTEGGASSSECDQQISLVILWPEVLAQQGCTGGAVVNGIGLGGKHYQYMS